MARSKQTPVADATAKAFGKKETGKHFVLELSKGKTEDFSIAPKVAAILTDGMEKAVGLDTFWYDNAETIVHEFWGTQIESECEGETRSAILKLLRGDKDNAESQKSYGKLFAALAQSSKYWQRSESAAARMNNHPKGSEAFDNEKTLRDQFKEKARKLASRQAQAIIGHYATMKAGEDAAGGQREQMGARATIETTIADWQALIGNMRGVYALPAERALLGAACDALRQVLARDRADKNPQSLISQPSKAAEIEAAVGAAPM